MSRFYYSDKQLWLKRRKHDAPPVHMYINCRAPFDPKNCALEELARYTSGAQKCFDWLLAQYPLAVAQGKAAIWERAAKSAVELFAGATLHTT